MVTPMSDRRDRYLYLGGPVATARARARRVAVAATMLYAGVLFGMVMLGHGWMDREQQAGVSVQDASQLVPSQLVPVTLAPVLLDRAHRF